jgi:hypothetical protein
MDGERGDGVNRGTRRREEGLRLELGLGKEDIGVIRNVLDGVSRYVRR